MGVRTALVAAICLLASISLRANPAPAADPSSDPELTALVNRGVALMGQFEYEAARKAFQAAAERAPENREIQVNLAIAILNRQERGDEPEALTILERVLEKAPNHPRALYCSGLLELHAGRPDKALANFRNVLALDPGDMDAAYFSAQSLSQMSKYKAALEWYREVIHRAPHIRSAYYGAFMAHQRLRDRAGAMAMLKEFKRLKKDPRARLVEFKYTKSGSKARVKTIGAPPPRAVRKPSGPLFEPAAPLLGETGSAAWAAADPERRAGVTVCDINGDGVLDIFITRAIQTPGGAGPALLFAHPGEGGYTLAPAHPLAGVLQVNAALWGDMDNDGLTDLYLCRTGPNQLWRQVEKGRWRDVTEATKTAGGPHDTVDGALFDADHDGDLDLFLVNADGPNALLNNDRDGAFRPLAEDLGLTGNGRVSRSLVTTDLDGDRDVDLVVINAEPPHEVYRNERIWRYATFEGWEAFLSADVAAAAAGDVNADGQVELYTLDAAAGLFCWTPDEEGAWKGRVVSPRSSPESGDVGPGVSPRPWLALADVDGEGVLDLVMTTPGGWQAAAMDQERLIPLFTAENKAGPSALALLASEAGPHVLAWTPGRPPHRWPAGRDGRRYVAIELSGKEDHSESMRSNASGIGARVAFRVGSRWTAVHTFRDHSGPGQGLQPLMAGLGQAEKIDFVAIDWSDGVYQTEMDLPAGGLHRIAETQRQLSSCPVLFAWDGQKHRFVSDILGVGGMGYAVGPGEYAQPRPWENLMLPEGLPSPRNGRLILKLTEPMEEATYLDSAGLKAYGMSTITKTPLTMEFEDPMTPDQLDILLQEVEGSVFGVDGEPFFQRAWFAISKWGV